LNVRQKVKDLVELAADDRTPEKERVAAAFKAIRIIRKHDLLSSPLDGLLEDDEVVEEITSFVSGAKKIVGRLGRLRRR
jgi:hypothetical protein